MQTNQPAIGFTFENCIKDVAAFHEKFGIAVNPLDDVQQYNLRVKRQDEEFEELSDAYNKDQTVADVADAVIDILYIAAGTMHLLGNRDGSLLDSVHLSKDVLRGYFASLVRVYRKLPLGALWAEVHEANMRKARGTEGTSKYGNKYDIVKPQGWMPPDIATVLLDCGINPLQSANTWANEHDIFGNDPHHEAE